MTNFVPKFLHEKILENINILYSDHKDLSKVPIRYTNLISLLFIFESVSDYLLQHNNGRVPDNSKELTSKITTVINNAIDECWYANIAYNPYFAIIESLNTDFSFVKISHLMACLNIAYDKKEAFNYVFSKNVTDVLLGLGDITDKCQIPFDLTPEFIETSKNHSFCRYFYYKDIKLGSINEVHAYTYEDLTPTKKFYCIIVRYKESNFYGLNFIELDIKDDYVTNINSSNCIEIDPSKKDSFDEDEFKNDVDKLPYLVFASEVFIKDQPDLIQEKINEFADKKSKKDYQIKHFTSSKYSHVDIPYKHVKAYSDKTFSQAAHFAPRWYGKGKKKKRITFIKGCPNKSFKNIISQK